MQLKLATVITAALTVTSVSATIQSKDIVKTIDTITDISADTDDILMDLNPRSLFTAVPVSSNFLNESIRKSDNSLREV